LLRKPGVDTRSIAKPRRSANKNPLHSLSAHGKPTPRDRSRVDIRYFAVYPQSARLTPGNFHASATADHPLVPHGISVILNAPAVFRFTASAHPARHLLAAEALGAKVSGAKDADAGRILADRIVWFMERLGVPNGLKALGYSSADIPSLVEGTLPQHRVTKLSPRPAGPDDLAAMFEDAMQAW
jgi:hypothetical protein